MIEAPQASSKPDKAATPHNPREAITYYSTMEEREADRAPLSLHLIRRIFTYTRAHASKRNWLFVCTMVRGAQLPLLAWMIGATINGPIAGRDKNGIHWYSAVFLLMVIFTAITFHFRQRLALQLGEAVVHDMRSALFRKLMDLPMSFFHRTKFGRIISRMTSDIDGVRVGVQDVIFVSIVQFLQMLVSAALMAWYNWKLFSIMLLFAPVIWAVNEYYRKEVSYRLRKVQESWSRLSSTIAESVSGIRVTQAFVRHEINAGFFRKLVGSLADNNIGAARATAVFIPLLQMKSQLFLGIMALLGGYGALSWQGWLHMEVGDLVMFFFLANLFFEPVQVIGNQYNQALASMAGAERFFQLMDLQPDWTDSPTAKPLPSIRGHVEFQQVNFAYKQGRNVLEDISFTVEPGQSVALVGHTGSGKTTIAGLIQKFYLPTIGRVLIDGHDILDITSESLHKQMGSVQQNNFLFTGTVAQNILLGHPNGTIEDVRSALKSLDCLDLIEALPQGLNTMVGDKSASLSLGQRQLVCFARAFIVNPRILVLDEATSAIDTITEARLQKAMEVLLRGRTSFIVAHRLSTIREADLVLVLDSGRIVERGNHESLLKSGGVYARLHAEFIGSATHA